MEAEGSNHDIVPDRVPDPQDKTSWFGYLKTLNEVVNSNKIAEKVIDRALSVCESEVSRFNGFEEQLTRLRSTVQRINALLRDADRRHIQDDTVKDWLCKLKAVSFDSEDLLDSYQTTLNKYKHNKEEALSRKRKWSYLDISFSFSSLGPELGLLLRRTFSLEIDKINRTLDDIARERNNLSTLSDSEGTRRELPRESTRVSRPGASHDRHQIVGRETEVNEIVNILTDSRASWSRKTVPVVAIHGVAGIGKTSLARLVFAHERVEAYFDLKIWVSLTYLCDATNVTNEIFEKMTNQSCDHCSWDTLQKRLREHLESLNKRKKLKSPNETNKFLLVIDNVWAEGFRFWEDLRIPLLSGGEGSKVLITTRNETVYKTMSPLLHLTKLTGLEKQDLCWEIMKLFALPQGFEGKPELVQVGMEIANRCHGSPLAAKTIGAFLRDQKEEEWRNVLYEMQSLKRDQNNTLPSLLVSYHHLPYHIKQCFAYCSIFPIGYLFDKNKVISYWMAEGLIEHEGRRRLEHVGEKYFDDLMWRSFFEKFNGNDRNDKEWFRIPSMMHDMARLISEYEFVDLDYDDHQERKTKPEQFRYASLMHRLMQRYQFKNAFNFANLRTLILCSESRSPLKEVPQGLFAKLTHLRVLDFSNTELTEFPVIAEDQLIHLRYLGLSNTLIEKLPESVCKLYNLQTIELGGCTRLSELPAGTSKLVNMRHLGFHINWGNIIDKNLFPTPPSISKLTSLQTFSRFNVDLDSNGKCNISELKDLNLLRGELCISNLENITDEEDAKSANLEGKQFIEKLMLRWSDGCMKKPNKLAIFSVITESLKPHSRLKCLWFVNYPDIILPKWLGDPYFTNLETIRISNLQFVPKLERLERLKHLYIEKISVKTIHSFAPYRSLQTLTIVDMDNLEKIAEEQDIPTLRKLKVFKCPKLRELVIHRNLYPNKFEIQGCSNMPPSRIVCVPQD